MRADDRPSSTRNRLGNGCIRILHPAKTKRTQTCLNRLLLLDAPLLIWYGTLLSFRNEVTNVSRKCFCVAHILHPKNWRQFSYSVSNRRHFFSKVCCCWLKWVVFESVFFVSLMRIVCEWPNFMSLLSLVILLVLTRIFLEWRRFMTFLCFGKMFVFNRRG